MALSRSLQPYAVRGRFGAAKNADVSMKNEVVCRVLCHNVCCLISAMHELGVQPQSVTAERSPCEQGAA
jgi:hypothetical protein